jgi:hypothetical protein
MTLRSLLSLLGLSGSLEQADLDAAAGKLR